MAASTHECDLFMAYCQGQMSLRTWYLTAGIQLIGTEFAQLKCLVQFLHNTRAQFYTSILLDIRDQKVCKVS